MTSLRIHYRGDAGNIDLDAGHIEHMAPDEVDEIARLLGAIREDIIKAREGTI